ncbi:hypothetical protein J8273_8023 [Carpediemonas membranifera]|uniref:Transmembrane protein n=1 Tax=Carpediemonas membranifera TaxID=201153 RepID=A0A8J6B5V7_9EUKA|nr:hypothetical protein J8273_8023 [Carpediemonas membranifera]|eukprot:KAG9390657.1 hypothetical protein J8273_8023 [Carpediemonas membranifera]
MAMIHASLASQMLWAIQIPISFIFVLFLILLAWWKSYTLSSVYPEQYIDTFILIVFVLAEIIRFILTNDGNKRANIPLAITSHVVAVLSGVVAILCCVYLAVLQAYIIMIERILLIVYCLYVAVALFVISGTAVARVIVNVATSTV